MPKNITKKKKIIKNTINLKQIYTFNQAIDLLKKIPQAKFEESIEIAINYNIYPKKQNFNIKGFSILPNKTGKKIKVAAFVLNDEIELAKKAKADFIIDDSIINDINKNIINFDILVTTPSSMLKIGKLSKILGPKGLMPNIKYGTINENIYDTIKNIKTNYIKFKSDKSNIIHSIIGKTNCDAKSLKENIEMLIDDIKKQKPKECKSMIIKKIFVSSTMGPGLNINLNSLNIH